MAEYQDPSPQATSLERVVPAWLPLTGGCSKCNGEDVRNG